MERKGGALGKAPTVFLWFRRGQGLPPGPNHLEPQATPRNTAFSLLIAL